MSQRITLPSSLSGATLTRSGEGVTFANRTASIPASTTAARTINPTGGQAAPGPEFQKQEVAETSENGYKFDIYKVIWVIIIPIIVWIILFSWKPNFVIDLINGRRVLNTSKLLLWTIIISAVILALGWFIFVAYPSRKA